MMAKPDGYTILLSVNSALTTNRYLQKNFPFDPKTAFAARDDFILQERLSGRSARSLSKELRCSVGDVDAALDRVLPKLDNATRLRHISLDLHRMDELLKVFLARATEKADVPAGLLCVKILERKAALLGLDAPTKLDIVEVQTQQGAQDHHQRLFEMIMRIGSDRQLSDSADELPSAGNGNGSGLGSEPHKG